MRHCGKYLSGDKETMRIRRVIKKKKDKRKRSKKRVRIRYERYRDERKTIHDAVIEKKELRTKEKESEKVMYMKPRCKRGKR